ncbi:integrase core domain-containing protein [Halospina denitrificans]|uniref:integrase core domain-containing protein n=1 Tax=Halospina denitrificans TaxID=332522 RepID=UPI003C7C3C33
MRRLSRSTDAFARNASQWRMDYNQVRPHSALGWSTPADYARKHAVSGPRRRLKEPDFSSNGWY